MRKMELRQKVGGPIPRLQFPPENGIFVRSPTRAKESGYEINNSLELDRA